MHMYVSKYTLSGTGVCYSGPGNGWINIRSVCKAIATSKRCNFLLEPRLQLKYKNMLRAYA